MVGIKALVIGMGVLLLSGFVIIAVTLIGRAQSKGAAEPYVVGLDVAPGERLVEANFDGSRAMLRFETPTGSRLEVRDLGDGALIGRFDVRDQR